MTGNDFMRFGAPLLAAAGVWAAQQAITHSYRAAAGSAPPKPDDLDAPITRVLLFAGGTAVVAAVVNVLITRGVARASANRKATLPVA